MNSVSKLALASLIATGVLNQPAAGAGAQSAPQASVAPLPDIGERRTITEADCTSAKLGTVIPVGAIGEPVSSVTIAEPKWMAPPSIGGGGILRSLIDKMSQPSLARFARLFVMPQAGHGLSGRNYSVDGDGKTLEVALVTRTRSIACVC